MSQSVSGREATGVARLTVDLTSSGQRGMRSYDVIVGRRTRERLAREIARVLPRARRAAVITQEGIDVVVDSGLSQETFVIASGEGAKRISTVGDLCGKLAGFHLNRDDVVVAVGGGVVTDVAGFTAACYHRGVALVNVPTSLLAQVDAAVGGKTGVNLPEGKNLVGAFWHPALVLADTEVLESLPEREWRSGMGEVAKYCFLGAGDLRGVETAEMVARCLAIKVGVVSADQYESRHRMILNYGHTFGHAVEAACLAVQSRDPSAGHEAPVSAGMGDRKGMGGGDGEGALVTHGEAVSIGLVFAARLARRIGRIDDARVRHHEELVSGFGLPTRPPPELCREELVSYMLRDKKSLSGPTFVLDGPSGVEPVEGVPEKDVLATMAEMGCRP